MPFFEAEVGGAFVAEKSVAMADEELVDADHRGCGGSFVVLHLVTGQSGSKAIALKERCDPLEAPLQRSHHAVFVARGQPRFPLVHPACIPFFNHLYDQFYQRGTGAKGRAASWGSGVLFFAQFCEFLGDQPAKTEECEQRNQSLGDDAVETPNLKNVFLDVGEIEGESKRWQQGSEEQSAPPQKGQQREHQVTRDADGRDRNVLEFRVRAVVHDAAVPLFVDGTRLGAGGVVNLKSQRGNHNAGEGHDCNEIAHSSWLDCSRGTGAWQGRMNE